MLQYIRLTTLRTPPPHIDGLSCGTFAKSLVLDHCNGVDAGASCGGRPEPAPSRIPPSYPRCRAVGCDGQILRGSIVVAVLTNALLLLYMLLTLFYTKSEDPERTQQQIQYLRDHRSGVTLVGFLALIKFDCLQLLFSKIAFFRDTCSAPLPEVDQDRVVVWGATGTMIEDVPQFILLVMTYKELHGAMDNFGMITCIMTGCSIVVSLINRVIAWTTMRVDRRELTLSPDELSAIVDEVTERISVGGLFAAVKAQRFEELDARSQELDARSQLLEARCQETNIQDQVAEVVRETARRRTSDLNSTSPVAI